MINSSNQLSKDDVSAISAADDFHISVLRDDGKTFGTLTWIWSVSVDDSLFVRAYYGKNSRWYKAALKQKAGKIQAAGMTKEVRFEPMSGDLNDRIDDAYRKKYKGSPYLNGMISERARTATIQVLSIE